VGGEGIIDMFCCQVEIAWNLLASMNVLL